MDVEKWPGRRGMPARGDTAGGHELRVQVSRTRLHLLARVSWQARGLF